MGISGVKKVPGRATALRFLAPHVLDKPVETERLERLRQWLAGLPIEADLAIPRADHLVPLLADRLPLGRTVHRRRPVALRRPLEVRRDAATERDHAENRAGASAELDALRNGVIPSGRCAERAADVLEPRSRREDA